MHVKLSSMPRGWTVTKTVYRKREPDSTEMSKSASKSGFYTEIHLFSYSRIKLAKFPEATL